MLTVYRDRSEIPEGIPFINCNAMFFDGHTKLSKDDLCIKIMKDIDGAEYQSDVLFIGRNKKNRWSF